MPRFTLKRILICSAYSLSCVCVLVVIIFQQEEDEPVFDEFEDNFPGNIKWYLPEGKLNPERDYNSIWPEDNPSSDRIESQLLLKPKVRKSKLKTIYLPNGLDSWEVSSGAKLFTKQKCPVHHCRLTAKKSLAESADAILFKDFFMLPRHKRATDQIWIMYMLESPLNTATIHDRDVFNWTATYRHDSELVTPYEKWVYYNDSIKTRKQDFNYAANKTKKVAWFVSNCAAKNRRLQFAKELQKFIDVDIYGHCGTKTCPRTSETDCFELLSRDYKFYLSFENSNCRDYITEKFYKNGLGNNILPIVMGALREDYERTSPHRSFIHVDDFATAKDLADYLHVLDRSDDRYNEYFQWKGTGEFIDTHFFCRLCALLHHRGNRSKTYGDLNEWWRGDRVCTKGSWRNLDTFTV